MTHPLPTRRSSDRDEAVLQARAGTRVADHRQVDQQAAHVAVVKCDRLAARFLDAALPLRGMRVPVVDAVDLLAQEKALADRALGERAELSADVVEHRSEEHTSELQSLMRISYAVFCLKKTINCEYRNNIII